MFDASFLSVTMTKNKDLVLLATEAVLSRVPLKSPYFHFLMLRWSNIQYDLYRFHLRRCYLSTSKQPTTSTTSLCRGSTWRNEMCCGIYFYNTINICSISSSSVGYIIYFQICGSIITYTTITGSTSNT